MIKIELYIEGVKADMFADESVTISDRVKDSKDPGQLFTAYTRQFSLPASKTNNKIFKHYHNERVITRFDARRKASALIKLNGADKYKGYVKLNLVDLKDNKAFSYKVQFFGELTSLKDLFGEDMLHDLAYASLTVNTLNKYNHSYDLATVKAGLEDSLVYSAGSMVSGSDGEIIYPLISHTTQFTVSSSGFHEFGDTTTKLNYVDLKPALRVNKIIEAIEGKYNISFGGGFFDGDMFNELFMWLHRTKGYMGSDASGATDFNWFNYMVDLDYVSGDPDARPLTSYYQSSNRYSRYTVKFEVNPVETGNYSMYILTNKPGTTSASENESGTIEIELELDSLDFPIDSWNNYETIAWNPLFVVHTEGGITTFTPTMTVVRTYRDGFLDTEHIETSVYDATGAVTAVTDVIIGEQMPKLKIIDFMRGLFKMFNLVAYETQETDGTYLLNVKPLDDWYADGKTLDITEYVDITASTVERVAPYNVVEFKYKEPKTFLITRANELSNIDFGNSTIALTDDSYLFDGGKYAVNLPFEKMMFERITNETTSVLSQIQWGWFVDDQETQKEPTLGSPLLFFRVNRDATTDNITWADASTSADYNAPSNVNESLDQTINFNAEIDEYVQGDANLESLFKNYHATYIQGIFDASTRRKKVTAYLPPRIINGYKLNDKIVISGIEYSIDSININLQNGKSQLDLLRMSGFGEKFTVNKWVQVGWVDEGWVD